MKILHVPFCYYPDAVGGTEVYVAALAREQRHLGHEVEVAAPGDTPEIYTYEQTTVRRYTVRSEVLDLYDLYGKGDGQAISQFGTILEASKPTLVHIHAYTRGVSLGIVRAIKQFKIPAVFTYHTPTVSCQRGTLLRWGTEVCDGLLRLGTCTRCTLHGHGLSRVAAACLSMVPVSLGHWLRKLHYGGKRWTAFRMRSLIHFRHKTYDEFMAEMDRIVVLNRWTYKLLLRHHLPADRLALVRHGLAAVLPDSDDLPNRLSIEHGPLRIAFLGRMDHTKGLDILFQAIQLYPDVPMELHIFGVDQHAQGHTYVQALRAMAEADTRIVFHDTIPHAQIVDRLRSYHLLAVPSRILETGPLVVLEAFAAGTPVVGAQIGGIGELVEHGVDGLLVDRDNPVLWGQALYRLATNRAELRRLTEGVQPPRRMAAVADEIMAVYEQVLSL